MQAQKILLANLQGKAKIPVIYRVLGIIIEVIFIP